MYDCCNSNCYQRLISPDSDSDMSQKGNWFNDDIRIAPVFMPSTRGSSAWSRWRGRATHLVTGMKRESGGISSIKDDDDRWNTFRFASLSSASSSRIPFSFMISLWFFLLLHALSHQWEDWICKRDTLTNTLMHAHTHGTRCTDKHGKDHRQLILPPKPSLTHDMALGIDQHTLLSCLNSESVSATFLLSPLPCCRFHEQLGRWRVWWSWC